MKPCTSGTGRSFFFSDTFSEDDLWKLVSALYGHMAYQNVLSLQDYNTMAEELANRLKPLPGPLTGAGVVKGRITTLLNMYNLFKILVFTNPGVTYNLEWNKVELNQHYWNLSGEELETFEYFRAQGFVWYHECYELFEVKGLQNYARNWGPALDQFIPAGQHITKDESLYDDWSLSSIEPPPQAFKLTQADLACFTRGWEFDDEESLLTEIKERVEQFDIISEELFQLIIDAIVLYYNEPDGPLFNGAGIRMKLKNIYEQYELFKVFVFCTKGVLYNFLSHEARVGEEYWANYPVQEPSEQACFRDQGFYHYQNCYYLFEVKGLGKYVRPAPRERHKSIPSGIQVSTANIFRSYYRPTLGN